MHNHRHMLIRALTILIAAHAVFAGADDVLRDRAKWRFATISAAKRAQEAAAQLVDLDPTERVFLTEYLAGAMQSNVTAHAVRAESIEKSRQLARIWRLGSVEIMLQHSAETMAAHSSAPVTVADVKNALGPDWPALVGRQVDAFLDKTFAAVYDESRGRVVALAAMAADRSLKKYPAQSELDAKLSGLADGRAADARLTSADFDALPAWLERQAGVVAPTFEEVRVRIANVGARMQSEIFRQYKFQVKALDEALIDVPGSLLGMDVILPHVAVAMDRRLADLRTEHGAPRYNIFQIVARNRAAAAKALQNARLAEQQYADHFAMLEENIPLSEKCLAIIHDQRGIPPDTAAAAVQLMRVGGYTGLPNPAKLDLLDETGAKILKIVTVRVGDGWRAIAEQLELLRALEAANIEMLRKEVAEGRPIHEITTTWRDELAGQWQKKLATKPSPYTYLLAGTQRQLDKTVRQLYDGIRKESDSIQTSLAMAGASDKSEPVAARELEARTENEHDQAVGSQARDAISVSDDTAGDFAKALGALAARNPCCPDGVLLLTDGADGLCEVKLFSVAGPNGSARFDPNDAAAAADAVFAALQPALEAMIAGAKERWTDKGLFAFLRRKPSPEFRLYMIVESNEIRHRMSLMLHRQIEAMLADWSESAGLGARPVTLDWRVGLNFSGINDAK